jgi:asparagine synthase (glutamine-hydrolysing)
MCGIGCFIWKNNFHENEIEATLKSINDTQVHRGPDYSDYFIDRLVGLCHTRLSIIDLSEKAMQPFISDDKNYVLVYNGEVYNFKEIGEELERNGVRLSTESDTEVVLKSYIFWGDQCFKKFNGMFAFILYDIKVKKLFVVRDRLGIKSLHFYSDDDCVILASEVKAILKLLKKYSCRSQSLRDILLVGHIEGTKTCFKNISTLQPGKYMEIDLNTFTTSIKTYANVINEINPRVYQKNIDIPLDHSVQYLDELIHHSVKMHLISDVPVGSLCSGGIDSSLITTIASRYNHDINIYHAGVEEENWGEEKYAELIADHLNIEINYIKMNKKIFLDNLVDTTYHLDIPLYHPSDVSLNQICSLAHAHGVKVLLCGEGADELFGGYPWHKDFLKKLQIQKKLNNLIFNAIKTRILNKLEYSRDKNYNFLRGILHTNKYSYNYLLMKDYPLLLNDGENIIRWDQIYNSFHFLEDMNDRLVNTLLIDNLFGHLGSILYRTDRMGMMASIENRVPFLENNIINYAINLPVKYKIAHNESKFILKKVAEKYLPKEVIYRKKRGFPVPWMNYIEYNEDFFENGFVEDFLSVPLDILQKLIANDKYLLFKLMNIEIWGRIFIHQENHETIKRLVH